MIKQYLTTANLKLTILKRFLNIFPTNTHWYIRHFEICKNGVIINVCVLHVPVGIFITLQCKCTIYWLLAYPANKKSILCLHVNKFTFWTKEKHYFITKLTFNSSRGFLRSASFLGTDTNPFRLWHTDDQCISWEALFPCCPVTEQWNCPVLQLWH